MEKDDEVKGGGESYDFWARMYDPRLCRFSSLDPLKDEYTDLTPYAFAANAPIANIDKDGKGPAAVLLGAFIGFASEIISEEVENYLTGQSLKHIDWADVATSTVEGALNGLIPGLGFAANTTKILAVTDHFLAALARIGIDYSYYDEHGRRIYKHQRGKYVWGKDKWAYQHKKKGEDIIQDIVKEFFDAFILNSYVTNKVTNWALKRGINQYVGTLPNDAQYLKDMLGNLASGGIWAGIKNAIIDLFDDRIKGSHRLSNWLSSLKVFQKRDSFHRKHYHLF